MIKEMILFPLLSLLIGSSSSVEGESCCQKKKVGDVNYMLSNDDPSLTTAYGCKNGCIYTTEQNPDMMFCFQNGLLPVECLDEFHWSYESDGTGPESWGIGYESQSPIDIPPPPESPTAEGTPLVMTNYDQVRIERLGNIEESYPDKTSRLTDGTFKNNGHTAQLDVVKTLPDDVGVLSGGPLEGEYKILQLHFHWGSDDSRGSEHTLNGESFPIELHIVHTKVGAANPLNTTRGLAVTGFFFQIASEDNEALSPLIDELDEIRLSESNISMLNSSFKISDLVSGVAPVGGAGATIYSTYDGSLTTPGCNEVVHWINFLTPLNISASQLAMFRTLDDKHGNEIVDNFRPPQPLNGRPVDFFGAAP